MIAGFEGPMARYLVRVAELGHVAEGNGSHGLLLDFELVEEEQQKETVDA